MGTNLIQRIKGIFKRDLSPSQAFAMGLDAWIGPHASSREVVNPQTMLGIAAAFAAVRNISEDLGKLPTCLYTEDSEGNKERLNDSNYPVQRLLRAPNSEMTPMSFRETLTAHALSYGSGYAEIQRNVQGTPVALWPLVPSDVTIVRDVNGNLKYRVFIRTNQYNEAVARPGQSYYVELNPDDVLHVRGLGYNGISSYCLSIILRECFGNAIAIDRFTGGFFGNGLAPSGVFIHPQALSAQAITNLRQSLERRYAGAANSHNVMILEEGMQYTPTSTNNDNAQLNELKQLTVDEVARIFRIPPHKIGSLARATFSNIEQQSLEYVSDCLQPWAVRWEQEIERKLIADGSDIYVRFDFNSLLRGDSAARGAFYTQMLSNGVYSINDVRRMEDMEPIDDGDEHFIQSNLVSLDKALNPPPPPAPVVAPAPDSGSNPNPDAPKPNGAKPDAPKPAQPTAPQRAALKSLLVDCLSRTLRVELKRSQPADPVAVANVLRASVTAAAAMFGRDAAPYLARAVEQHCSASNEARGMSEDEWSARAYSEAEEILRSMQDGI